MFPFFDILGFKIPMYGLMCALAVLAAYGLVMLRIKNFKITKDDAFNVILFAIIGAIVGAKIFYVITEIPKLSAYGQLSLTTVLSMIFSGSGLVFYGGFIGGILAVLIYVRVKKIDMRELIDLIIPAIPLAHAIGRIGCFFAGCCYGIECEWGLYFNLSNVAPHNIPLLPTQLIESACNIIIFFILLLWQRKLKIRGSILGGYLILYSIVRFILEFFRADDRGVLITNTMTPSQIISIVLFIGGILVIFLTLKSKEKKEILEEQENETVPIDKS